MSLVGHRRDGRAKTLSTISDGRQPDDAELNVPVIAQPFCSTTAVLLHFAQRSDDIQCASNECARDMQTPSVTDTAREKNMVRCLAATDDFERRIVPDRAQLNELNPRDASRPSTVARSWVVRVALFLFQAREMYARCQSQTRHVFSSSGSADFHCNSVSSRDARQRGGAGGDTPSGSASLLWCFCASTPTMSITESSPAVLSDDPPCHAIVALQQRSLVDGWKR